MADANSTVTTVNPLIDEESPIETLGNVKGVIWFLDFTVPSLIGNGSSESATHGLAMILECAAQALDHATQAMQSKEVKHA